MSTFGIIVAVFGAFIPLLSYLVFRYYKYARNKYEEIEVEKKMTRWDNIYLSSVRKDNEQSLVDVVSSSAINFDSIYNVTDVESAESDALNSLGSYCVDHGSRSSEEVVSSKNPHFSILKSPEKMQASDVLPLESEKGLVQNVAGVVSPRNDYDHDSIYKASNTHDKIKVYVPNPLLRMRRRPGTLSSIFNANETSPINSPTHTATVEKTPTAGINRPAVRIRTPKPPPLPLHNNPLHIKRTRTPPSTSLTSKFEKDPNESP